jgi:hypothetical protein
VKRDRLIVFAVVLSMASTALAAATAGAAIVPRALTALQSVQFDADAIYWFKRGPADDYRGSVVRRAFGGAKPEVIYTPGRNESINGFKVRDGVIAIGLATQDERARATSSEVGVLRESSGKWEFTQFAAGSEAAVGGACGTRVGLVGSGADGRLLIEDRSYAGANGACDLVRATSSFRWRAAPDEGAEAYGHVSGWALSRTDTAVEYVAPGQGDWAFTRTAGGGYYDDEDNVRAGLRNLRTGELSEFTFAPQIGRRIELSADGRLLLNDPAQEDRGSRIFTDPHNLNAVVTLRRKGSLSWFHLCGDSILEISRRERTRRHRSGSQWNLYLRDLDGNVVRRVKQRLDRGTDFEACNGDNAYFHHFMHDGRARQFNVGLR